MLKELLLKSDFIKSKYWDLKCRTFNRKRTRILEVAKNKIVEKAKNNVPIVVFLIGSRMQTWFYDDIYYNLMSDSLFDVYAVIAPFVKSGKADMKQYMKELSAALDSKHIRYIKGFDETTDQYIDVKKMINPDIVLFSTNYDPHTHEFFQMSNYNESLNFIISYGMHVVDNPGVYSSMANYLCYKEYLPDKRLLKIAQRYRKHSDAYYKVVGSPKLDELNKIDNQGKEIWKTDHKCFKRIIWAPHFSFEETGDVYVVASFLEIYDFMLQLAKEYSDSIEFVFKPHPLLKHELARYWDNEKIESYYKAWDSMDNTQYYNGSYAELFKQSDAMIFDSISFIVEYLFSGKPALYTICKNARLTFNEFGMEAFNLHYHTNNIIHDIKEFIDSVVLQGNDVLKNDRTKFIEEFVGYRGDNSSKLIYKDIKADIEDILMEK